MFHNQGNREPKIYQTCYLLSEERRAKCHPKNRNGRRLPDSAFELSKAVIAQAESKGLRVQTIVFSDQKRWDCRSIVIENKPCQIVRTRCYASKPGSLNGLRIRLYLPRTDWPDFIIYVVRQPISPGTPECYIIPRGVLSKDTQWCPSKLEKYRDAWKLFREMLSPELIERRFTEMNWQLRSAITAALNAGLEVNLVGPCRPRPWKLFLQTRVIIKGRRCTLHSLSRINPDPNQNERAYVALRKEKLAWTEFQLYVLPDVKEPVVYIIPSNGIKISTSVSLQNEKLALYRNNWNVLTEPALESDEIKW